jgi:hypothetical protein
MRQHNLMPNPDCIYSCKLVSKKLNVHTLKHMKSATAFKIKNNRTWKFAHRDFWYKIKTLEKPTRGKPVREGRFFIISELR